MSGISVNSEIGRLRKVIVHEPGQEMENMTPANAAEALYDDLLFLPKALEEHRQLTAVLRQVAQVYELLDLLATVMQEEMHKRRLVTQVCALYDRFDLEAELVSLSPVDLAHRLVAGTPAGRDTLVQFLSPNRYALLPLPNAFFMRDATMCVNDRVIIGSMAHRVRVAEALLLRTIFNHHPDFQGGGYYLDATEKGTPNVTIEGGDLLVIREDLLVIGYGQRTSVAGIDVLLQALAQVGRVRDVLVVEIPQSRATIHLDMIFTMIDRDLCVIYPPLITGTRKCHTIHVAFHQGRIRSIHRHPDLLQGLDSLGLHLTPIACGGADPVRQDREQWFSGANFFAVSPGKIIGYDRNQATFAELAHHGFETVYADEIAAGQVRLDQYDRCVVAMSGAELSRGGGGCRCMTLPVLRDAVNW